VCEHFTFAAEGFMPITHLSCGYLPHSFLFNGTEKSSSGVFPSVRHETDPCYYKSQAKAELMSGGFYSRLFPQFLNRSLKLLKHFQI